MESDLQHECIQLYLSIKISYHPKRLISAYIRPAQKAECANQSTRGVTASLRYIALSALLDFYHRCMYADPTVAILQIPLVRRGDQQAGGLKNKNEYAHGISGY